MGQSKQKEMFIACGSSQSSSLPASVVPSHIGSTATTSTKQSISQSSSAVYAIAAPAAEESDVPRATHLCADNKSAACAKPRLNHRPFRRQSYRHIWALPSPQAKHLSVQFAGGHVLVLCVASPVTGATWSCCADYCWAILIVLWDLLWVVLFGPTWLLLWTRILFIYRILFIIK